MKTPVILFVFAVIVLVYVKSTEIKDRQEIKETCKNETGFDGSLVSSNGKGASKAAKCYLACVMRMQGQLKEDGTMIIEKSFIYQSIKGDPEKRKRLEEAIAACSNEVKSGPDVCEYVFNTVNCRLAKVLFFSIIYDLDRLRWPIDENNLPLFKTYKLKNKI